MIKKEFDDGCVGVKLYGAETNERNLKRYLSEISPLSSGETDILVSQIMAREEDIRVFAESGYRVGWKRSPTFSFVVVVFCPLKELMGYEGGEQEGGYL